MKELFRDIPGYNGLYKVSNVGRVKSLDRRVRCKGGGNSVKIEKILKGNPGIYGYLSVVLFKNGNKKNIKIHQLVSMAFLGHVRCGHKIVIDHIDHDKTNNKVENLRLVTNRQNCSHRKNKYTSKYVGVSWDKDNNMWRSGIKIKGKIKNLGRFKDEFQAHLTYQNALKSLT